jgi:hypothetical protein
MRGLCRWEENLSQDTETVVKKATENKFIMNDKDNICCW